MLALSSTPQMFTNFSWPSYDQEDDMKRQQQNMYVYGVDHETDTSGSVIGSPSSHPQVVLAGINHNNNDNNDDDGTIIMVKKHNHNASERDRRKRINELYSSLRSLLPATDHKKKLSIPATISRVVKYIPELQEEVKRMVSKKEALVITYNNLKTMGIKKEGSYSNGGAGNQINNSSTVVVSASRLCERDVVIQISIWKSCFLQGTSIPAEALLLLELEGLLLLNMSTFESSQGRLFYSLHLQVLQGTTQVMDLKRLREKLLSLLYNSNQ